MWGAGYVDEIAAQLAWLSETATPFWYWQDANYDVVALTNSAGEVARQYAFEPYGQVVAAEKNSLLAVTAPVNRLGHQGLFFERFYWQPGESLTSTTSEALLPTDPSAEVQRYVAGLYYNRNRWYSPELGRFVQRESRAAAMPLLDASGQSATAPSMILNRFDPIEHQPDGCNLFAYVRANPERYVDPVDVSLSASEPATDVRVKSGQLPS